MANRRNYYYGQQVTEAQLDEGFDGLEQSDWNLAVDLGFVGVADGLTVTEHSPTPDLTVDVAIGTAYDKAGKRLRVPSLQVKSLAADSNSVSTAVSNPGNSKIVSLFLRFKRNDSSPYVDENAQSGNFVRDEGFEFVVVQGSEAVSPSPPAVLNDAILLADITRTHGQTQILNANISTTRREVTFRFTAGSLTVIANTAAEALLAILTELSNHVTGAANKHAATAIDYAGGPNWLDGTTNPATTSELQLDKIVTDLVASSGSSGAEKIGCDARTNWLGGRTNVAGVSVLAAIDKIITDLAVTDAGDDGAERIGAATAGNLPSGSVRSQLDSLDANKAGLGLNNTYTGTNTFGNTVAFNGQLGPSGAAARINLRQITLTDQNYGTFAAQQYDRVKVTNTVTANRTITLTDPTGQNAAGHCVRFTRANPDPDYKWDIKRHDSTQLAELPVVNGAWVELECVGVSWMVSAWGGATVVNEAAG